MRKSKVYMFSYQNESLSPGLHFVIRFFVADAGCANLLIFV